MNYKTEQLEKTVNQCKAKGYKVYAFQENTPISQVFIENQKGQIGTISDDDFKSSVTTVHKPNRYPGTGYEMSTNLEDYDLSFAFCPNWGDSSTVEKYKSFADYQKQNTILKYYEV